MGKEINLVHFILYVADQSKSTSFYSTVLDRQPTLNVPGMTEFNIDDKCVIGLMPEQGIKRLLGDAIQDPSKGSRGPRAELYLRVNDPELYHKRALAAGAKELSELGQRDWGDIAAYSEDMDGHVLAFAKKTT
ncbi:MAG: VOC family protein [Bdellovibrionales bacterium]|nr:VOC family protein [Bdellovibrionales bacterium]